MYFIVKLQQKTFVSQWKKIAEKFAENFLRRREIQNQDIKHLKHVKKKTP